MSDLQTVKTILNSSNEFDVAGTKKYQLDTESGKFDLWMTKRDGNQTKAYIDFCGLGELGCQVEIGYKVQQNGEYTNRVVMFMNKLGDNPVQQIDNANLEARVATLESQVKQLFESRTVQTTESKTINELADEMGGTVVSQTPVSSPMQPGDDGYVNVQDINF